MSGIITRIQHVGLALSCLPALMVSAEQRRGLAVARTYCQKLPARMRAPLPQALAATDADPLHLPSLSPPQIRKLVDLAALLERRSSLGICLRRSLLRYAALQPLGLALVINFGAKFKDGPTRKIGGHAWLTLDEQPFYEADENWRGYRVIYRWPQEAG